MLIGIKPTVVVSGVVRHGGRSMLTSCGVARVVLLYTLVTLCGDRCDAVVCVHLLSMVTRADGGVDCGDGEVDCGDGGTDCGDGAWWFVGAD